MDLSSELIHSLLPIFMTTVLGASMITVGIIEGVAEATAAITKVFSGALSDYLGKRKWVMVSGYALAALTKPVFPLANSISWVFMARFADRIGKGIRGAPRDALVADITPPELRGAAYGLRQALDSVGALLGPLAAVLLMLWLMNDIRLVMWLAVIPAMVTVIVLVVFLREPPRHTDLKNSTVLSLAQLQRLPLHYWLVVLLGGVFTLARFSEAFLILRAQDIGISMAYVPVIMIVMNFTYAGIAYPAGKLADRMSRRKLLMIGLLVLITADVCLAIAPNKWWVFAGAALWGLHMAFTQGLFSKLVADTAPMELRGTAFGFFNLISGVALLLASVIAGVVWNYFGATATFFSGAGFAIVTLAGLISYRLKS